LESLERRQSASAKDVALFLERQRAQIVQKCDLPWLQAAEEREARLQNVAVYKFPDDAGMLSAIEFEKTRPSVSVAWQSMMSLN
jgi:hypothetical protein